MKNFAKISLYVLMVAAFAFYLPRLYDALISERIEGTHLFYSPVSKKFIYTEKVAAYDPAAASKAEDHHADIVYKDQDGVYHHRLEFERLLPFIYYRNMEIRGYLPLEIDGKVFDKNTIRAERRVLELPARAIGANTPSEHVYPLFESMPDQAGLVFPDDRFRMTESAMEFINADYNVVDPDLTQRFTSALTSAGFVFPARLVAGNFTILKPYDFGVFIVDAEHSVYHVRRAKGDPVVVRTPISQSIAPRHIMVAESDREGYCAVMLGGDGSLYLIPAQSYTPIRMPLENYDPARMDFKIIFDPLYRTALWSDTATIRAVAMDENFEPVARYEHSMSRGTRTWRHEARDVLFPFTLQLDSHISRLKEASVTRSPYWLTWGLLSGAGFCLVFEAVRRIRRRQGAAWGAWGAIVAFGVFGFIAALTIEEV
ncbi:MAG: hypothetical protein DELT_00534 [Desulfovibrio sp.]